MSGPSEPFRDRPLRILLVVDSLDVGGAERQAVGLGAALVQQGHTVTIACSTAGALASVAERAGLAVRPVLRHLTKRRLDLRFAWELRRLLRQESIALVHAHLYASAAASAFATLGSRAPLVITEHSEARWRGPRARLYSRFIYRRAAHVIAVSRAIGQRLVAQDRVPPARLTVIPNTLFSLPTASAAPSSSVMAVPAGSRVGVVARLQPEKGVAHFVQAAALVAQRRPDVQFCVIGDGPLGSQLLALAARLGLSERVHFLGFRWCQNA